MFTEAGILALAKVAGLVVVCVAMIRMFGPTINLVIRKKLNLAEESRSAQQSAAVAAMQRADRGTFQFRCPDNHILEGTIDTVGQPGKCPVCGKEFVIPSPRRTRFPDTSEPRTNIPQT